MFVSHIPFHNHSDIWQLTFYIKEKTCQFLQNLELDIYKTERCLFPTYLFPTILASLSTPPPPKKKRRNTLPCQIFHQIFTKRKKMLVSQYFFQPPPTQKTPPHTNTRTTLDSLKYKAGHLQKNRNKTPVSDIPFSNQFDSQLPAFMLHQSDFEDFCRQSRAKRSDRQTETETRTYLIE